MTAVDIIFNVCVCINVKDVNEPEACILYS